MGGVRGRRQDEYHQNILCKTLKVLIGKNEFPKEQMKSYEHIKLIFGIVSLELIM